MRPTFSTILISGTSHVGKSTLAGLLGAKLGCEAISTDSLARHPGRPWPGIPAPVEEYYTQLSAETIHWFLKVHHQNIWPLIRGLIDSKARTGNQAVFEGAALRPEFVAPLLGEATAGVFLHAENDFLLERMRSQARYNDAASGQRRIMDAFIERSLRENAEMMASARQLGMPLVDVENPAALDSLVTELVERASASPA
ncbi:hypothetical protein [Agrobacterium genomosp. 13]|uniref:2-phosphoglycerate kinase n=1 Tax=Agrobacterium genomosp. 13 str. CFBP 6927 TaxID=1183428 RepID=A0ABM9VAY5_9HYPH|nr:hypothetical protein [Agrobacterium genomosp. 13]CUX09217.1 Conserved hypothetical protein [Agrobacterium genomosp. 13 str. CFBP 6927]